LELINDFFWALSIYIVCGDENGRYLKCTSIDDRFLELHLRLDMGHRVTMMPDNTDAAEMQAAADAADLVIVPESVLSNLVGDKLIHTRWRLGCRAALPSTPCPRRSSGP
jgi:hypothetical protein